jgi:hypothetical protein
VSSAKNKPKTINNNQCKKRAKIKPSPMPRNFPISLNTGIGNHRVEGQTWKYFPNNRNNMFFYPILEPGEWNPCATGGSDSLGASVDPLQ